MIAPLVDKDKPILRKSLKPVKKLDKQLAQKIATMIDSAVIYGGIGLAANQVGFDMRVFVITSDPKNPLVFINPEIEVPQHTYRESGIEGCLSLPDEIVEKLRYKNVLVHCDGFDEKKPSRQVIKLQNRDARIAQHEMDHINGKLCTDKDEP